MLRPALLLALVGAVLAVTACTANSSGTSDAITVRSTSDTCEVADAEAPSGTLVFEVTNEGTEVTEFYLFADDGGIIGEVENIGPGTTRDLVVQAAPGSYITACKPGMVGDGIRSAFTVTD